MTIHTNGERTDAPLRKTADGNVIISVGEYRQHLIADHGYTEADFPPIERPDNLAQWRALDNKHEAARRSPCYSAEEVARVDASRGARWVDETTLCDPERVLVPGLPDDGNWTIGGEPLFANLPDDLTLPEDGSEVRISMEPGSDGTPTLDVEKEEEPTPEQPTSVLLGITRILSWYALPAITIGVQVATARRNPALRGYLLFVAGAGVLHTAARTIELHNTWRNQQATR